MVSVAIQASKLTHPSIVQTIRFPVQYWAIDLYAPVPSRPKNLSIIGYQHCANCDLDQNQPSGDDA